jgi:RNA polymerase sigma-70 factor (ECF subfamily)
MLAQPNRAALELQGFDAAYLERLRTGHLPTEQHFVDYFSHLIWIKLRSRRCPPNVVEDICQETFLRVLRALRAPQGLRDPGCLGAFVNSVCNNVRMEFLRSEHRHRPTAEGSDDRRSDTDPDPEASLIDEERKKKVRHVIERLPERDQRVLRALFLQERDKDEVCTEFGVDRDYLRVLLYRAKVQFRSLYAEEQPVKARVAVLGRERHSPWRSTGL